MYSGSTLRHGSGEITGVHQRINRIARRRLTGVPAGITFPDIKKIARFEGLGGPDGVKRKSPSVDEPWHFIDPHDPTDRALIQMIDDHVANLTAALKKGDEHRAAFEAAWLSHTIVDGLTPAHHFPLAKKIEELWGKPAHERSSVKEKNFIKGHNHRDTISKNWQYWGSGGIFMAHVLFEWGVASAMALARYKDLELSQALKKKVAKKGVKAIFLEALHDIDSLHMYETFAETGWTRKLARETRQQLIPRIIETVAASWYYAALQAGKKE